MFMLLTYLCYNLYSIPKTPVFDPSPWVPFNPIAALKFKNPEPTALKDAFDLYIDGVRFIPDNASMLKVTKKNTQNQSFEWYNYYCDLIEPQSLTINVLLQN